MNIETQTGPSATPIPNTSASASNNSTSETKISSDFETFLLMLTTQLENQDPLNPIESQDFAVQLATFSGVEQQVLTNDLLENLTGALGASDLAQLANWVGMEARVTAPVNFDGSPVDLVIDADPGSDRAQLVVKDSFGREVAREEVPTNGGTFSWAGQDNSGSPLNEGLYLMELLSINQGEVTSVQNVPHYARITEARQGANGVELVVAGGSLVSSSDVSALREPGEQ